MFLGAAKTTMRKKPFEKIVGKEENASNHHFFPFPTMLSALPKTEIKILATFNLSANALNLVMSKTLSFGKKS